MVTRSGARFFLWGVLALLLAAMVGCEKVPLLAPTGSTIAITTATSSLGFNGTAQVVAQVIEAAGTPPHSGTHVTFTTNLGTVEPSEVETDVNGRAVSTFHAGTSSGVATITAASGGSSATSGVKINVGAAAVTGLVVSANPTTVSANGGNSTITAKVSDNGGNSLAQIPVTFTTDAGQLSSSVSLTDANGVATTVLSTTRAATVTATAGVTTTTVGSDGKSTTTAPAQGTVKINVNQTATITVGSPVPATPSVNQTVAIPLTYTTGTGASPITHVTVDWGDGKTSNFTGAPTSITHAYTSAGSFLVVVTGFDALNDTSTGSTAITVSPRSAPTVSISASSSPQPGVPVTFTVTATAPTGATVNSILVDFGDGTQQTLSGNAGTVQHIYSAAGTYTVTATATDSNGVAGSGSTVIVVGSGGTAAPTASFTVSPPSGPVSTTFIFDGTGSTGTSALTYSWDFGDGTTPAPTGSSVTHKYAAAGTYTARLTVTDGVSRTSTTSKSVTVSDEPAPTASYTVTPTSGPTSTAFLFDGSASTGVTPLTYSWDFGDGSALGTGVSTTHKYASPGTYTSRLTVTDARGRIATTTKAVTVTVDAAPTAAFTITPTSGTVATQFFFNASTSTGTGLTYAWNFGDLATGTGVTSTHTYAAPSTYTVTLTVTDSIGRTATITHNVTVSP